MRKSIAVAALVILAVLGLAVKASYDRQKMRLTLIAEKNFVTLRKIRSVEEREAELDAEIAKLRRHVADLRVLLPNSLAVDETMKQLAAAASLHGITMGSYHHSKSHTDILHKARVTVLLYGDPAAIRNFASAGFGIDRAVFVEDMRSSDEAVEIRVLLVAVPFGPPTAKSHDCRDSAASVWSLPGTLTRLKKQLAEDCRKIEEHTGTLKKIDQLESLRSQLEILSNVLKSLRETTQPRQG